MATSVKTHHCLEVSELLVNGTLLVEMLSGTRLIWKGETIINEPSSLSDLRKSFVVVIVVSKCLNEVQKSSVIFGSMPPLLIVV